MQDLSHLIKGVLTVYLIGSDTCLTFLCVVQYRQSRKKAAKIWQESQVKFTMFEIFIFCPKIQLWFPEKKCRIVLGENSWKCCGLGLFTCWQLWFHEKNCQKNLGWKTRENVGDCWQLWFPEKIVLFCQNWIFGQKFDFSNSVQISLLYHRIQIDGWKVNGSFPA